MGVAVVIIVVVVAVVIVFVGYWSVAGSVFVCELCESLCHGGGKGLAYGHCCGGFWGEWGCFWRWCMLFEPGSPGAPQLVHASLSCMLLLGWLLWRSGVRLRLGLLRGWLWSGLVVWFGLWCLLYRGWVSSLLLWWFRPGLLLGWWWGVWLPSCLWSLLRWGLFLWPGFCEAFSAPLS